MRAQEQIGEERLRIAPPAARGPAGDLARFMDGAYALSIDDCSRDDAFERALRLICEFSGWPLGHVFCPAPQPDALVSTSIWRDAVPAHHRRFVVATAELRLGRGDGLPGQVLEQEAPVWLADLERERRLPRHEAALGSGLRAAFAFPVAGERGVEAVLELWNHRPAPRDDELLTLAWHLGRQTARLLDRLRAERRLRETERLAQLGWWTWDVERDAVEGSAELLPMHGMTPPPDADPRRVPAMPIGAWMSLVGPEHATAAARFIARLRAGEPVSDFEYTVLRGRSTRWMHVHAETVQRRPDGCPLHVSGFTQDVTERRRAQLRRNRAQRELAFQQRVLDQIARGASLRTVLTELCVHLEARFAGAHCSIMLLDRSEGVLRQCVSPTIPAEIMEELDGLTVGEGSGGTGTAAARGEIVIVEDAYADADSQPYSPLADRSGLRSVWSLPLCTVEGEILGTLSLYRDVRHRPSRTEIVAVEAIARLAALAVERSLYEAALQSAANLDSHTGLPNRSRFLELVDRELLAREGEVAVMMLGVERLEVIADGLGRLAADRILAEVAERLRGEVGDEGLVARFSGDAFTLMPAGHGGPERSAAMADRVLEAVGRPFMLDGGEFFLTAAIGIARGERPRYAIDLVREADAALQAARSRDACSRQEYDRRVRVHTLDRLEQESELRRAIERRELIMHYQPILDLRARRWSGVEALVRWQHPRRGLLAPDEFIPLAEETGLIVPLGTLVLEWVADQAAQWARSLPGIAISVNVSSLQLTDPDIGHDLLALLERAGVPCGSLVLEVTESAVMEELEAARRALLSLTAAGIRVVVDDFGTGYSSIARLGELPVTGLKIDRRITASRGSPAGAIRVLRAIAELARAHDLDVVAEGIEEPGALADVARLGYHFAQGYLLGRPAAPEVVERVLRRVPPPVPARA